MKTIISTIIALLLISSVAMTGFALDQKSNKSGGTADAMKEPPDNPDEPDPGPGGPEPETIKLKTKVTFLSVQYNTQSWSFAGFATNNTGKTIPVGAKIQYVYKSTAPGYFFTAGSTKKGSITLSKALAPNDILNLGTAVYVTSQSNPTVTCEAFYFKK